MKYFTSSLIALAFATMAVQAQAQDAAQAPPGQNVAQAAQPDTAPPPATPAPDTDAAPPQQASPPDSSAPPTAATPDAGATTTPVSDAEVDHFAKATVAVQKISADTKLDETAKQTKMAAAVKSAGIDPARYNEIGKALATDSALRAKVQMAMAKYAGPSQG